LPGDIDEPSAAGLCESEDLLFAPIPFGELALGPVISPPYRGHENE
jgi:hypothetical protein